MAEEIEGGASHFDLLSLDVNCLEKVFKFLPENDLAALSRTCRQLKQETERFFLLNHDCGKVHINNRDGIFQFDFSRVTKFEVVFRSQIRRVNIEFHQPGLVLDAFQYINENCAPSLLTLKISNERNPFVWIDMRIDREHCDLIATQLQKLLLLSVFDTPALEIMNRCENLLVLFTSNYSVPENSWMDGFCPKLEFLHFEQFEGDSGFGPRLINFFRRHPQLKAIVCSGQTAVKALCSIEHRLSYGAMVLIGEDNIMNIWNDFVRCCKQKHIEWLDLICVTYDPNSDNAILQRILDMKYVKSLHFRVDDGNFDFSGIHAIVERLCLDSRMYQNYLTERINKISEIFPNLRHLRLRFSSARPFEMIQNVILSIVSRLPLLEHFYFDCPIDRVPVVAPDFSLDPNSTGIDFVNLNAERAKLPNAIPVTIHFVGYFYRKYKVVQSLTNLVKADFDLNSQPCPLCESTCSDSNYFRQFVSYMPPID